MKANVTVQKSRNGIHASLNSLLALGKRNESFKGCLQSFQNHKNSVIVSASAYEAVIIGPDVTLTMSVSLPGDNKTHQSTIWQLYAAEVSAKSLRRRGGSAAEAQQLVHGVDSPLCVKS